MKYDTDSPFIKEVKNAYGNVYHVKDDGVIQEFILYASDQSSNRTNIEDNINTFYSIYWCSTS